MNMSALFNDVDVLVREGDATGPLGSVQHDSRQVRAGDVFVARRGVEVDGHDYLDAAARAGAGLLVVEEPPAPGSEAASVPWVQVLSSSRALGDLAANQHGRPTERMDVVGITGTNGKTTSAFLVEGAMQPTERSTGVVGTVLARWPGNTESLGMTTPDAPALQSLFGRMRDAGVDTAVLAVSSHALEQHRVDAVDFDVAAFTNLGRDHLDYHGTLASYADAKRRFFTEVLPASRNPRGAVINVDDATGDALAGECQSPVVRMGRNAGPGRDLYASDIRTSLGGIEATLVSDWGRAEVHSSLVGEHNLMNVLTAVGCGLLLDVPLDHLVMGIGEVAHVPGRLQAVGGTGDIHVLVDYAHTDDALSATLSSLKPLTAGRLIVVFGCGGDRDTGKRAPMGAVVARHADVAIVTSDNPRSEDPEAIMADVLAGMDSFPALATATGRGHLTRVDRRDAIHHAIDIAAAGDVVLIAGKGHEATQEFADHIVAFDDAAVAMEALQSRGGSR